jgi:hypothetical protein
MTHAAVVIQMSPNERIIKRFQSIWIPEVFTNSSYVTQHPRSFNNQSFNVWSGIKLWVENNPKITNGVIIHIENVSLINETL